MNSQMKIHIWQGLEGSRVVWGHHPLGVDVFTHLDALRTPHYWDFMEALFHHLMFISVSHHFLVELSVLIKPKTEHLNLPNGTV